MKVVLGHGASGDAASMKPYVVGFKRRGIDALASTSLAVVQNAPSPSSSRRQARHDVIGAAVVRRQGREHGGDRSGLRRPDLFSYPLHRPGSPTSCGPSTSRSSAADLFMSGDAIRCRIDLLKKWVKTIPNARLEIFEGQATAPESPRPGLDVATEFLKDLK